MNVPNTYLVFDTETQHFENAYTLQIGFCQVEDGQVKACDSLNVIPPKDLEISQSAIDVHGLTREHLEKTGADPKAILPYVRDLIMSYETGWLMGQNLGFDQRAINNTLIAEGYDPIDFTPFNIMDVGGVFKAYRLKTEWGWGARAVRKDISIADYFKFIMSQRIRGLKWNLDLCMEVFEVEADKRGDHDAGEDCRLTHLVYQKMVERGIVKEMLYADQ